MKSNKSLYISIFLMFLSISFFSQKDKEELNIFINQWHKDVAKADYNAYFDKMSENSVFIGTDAEEIWNKKQFKDFAKPYFDTKKTWNFTPLSRNIYFSTNKKIAWFDELLDTQMGICRGSGVLTKDNNHWKIVQYVLSTTIPNDDMKKVITIKKVKDSLLLKKLEKN